MLTGGGGKVSSAIAESTFQLLGLPTSGRGASVLKVEGSGKPPVTSRQNFFAIQGHIVSIKELQNSKKKQN